MCPKRRLCSSLGIMALACVTWSMVSPGIAAPTTARIELEDKGRALGTTYHILLVTTPAQKARALQALRNTRALVKRLRKRFSEWLPRSEISRINQGAGRKWVPLSPAMRKLLKGSLHVSRATKGAFDITWAPWGDLWKMLHHKQHLPTPAMLRSRKAYVDWKLVKLGPRGVRFLHPRTKLGIAGVAKGWIIDAAYHNLRKAGFNDVVVNIGGDLRTHGRNAAGKRRRFYISHPHHPKRFIGVIRTQDVAIATSGNYLRYRLIKQQRFGHIIDPRTGYPPPFKGSVTVLTRDATMADALATAMFVLGPTRGIALAKRIPGLEVVFATKAGLRASFKGVRRLSPPTTSPPTKKKK